MRYIIYFVSTTDPTTGSNIGMPRIQFSQCIKAGNQEGLLKLCTHPSVSCRSPRCLEVHWRSESIPHLRDRARSGANCSLTKVLGLFNASGRNHVAKDGIYLSRPSVERHKRPCRIELDSSVTSGYGWKRRPTRSRPRSDECFLRPRRSIACARSSSRRRRGEPPACAQIAPAICAGTVRRERRAGFYCSLAATITDRSGAGA
jgi:hypothetical protein